MNTINNVSKYKSKKVTINGIVFDSLLEGSFYTKFKNMGIEILEYQTSFVLIEAFHIEKELIRGLEYKTDFLIRYKGTLYYVDSKGMETPEFKLKHKLWLSKYGHIHKLAVTGSFNRLIQMLDADQNSTTYTKEMEGIGRVNSRMKVKTKKRIKKNTNTTDLKEENGKA